MKLKITGLTLLLALLAVNWASGQTQTNDRAQWFVHDRFGMFIHWGLYSGTEGIWKGEKIRYDNDYAEWIQYRNRISKDEYQTMADRFDWDSIDPEQWVILAKKAGMKYVTLTAKHHDGFALWNSASNDYNIYRLSGRDIVAELAAACKKHGLKLGLYYSHWVDWEHPYGWDNAKEVYTITDEQYDQYWQEKVMPQMRELLTNYGEISITWFDMWINHNESIVQKKQLVQLKQMIRELQPKCLVNSRLGLSIEEDPDVDFRTLGDNELGTEKLDYPWQTPATVAHSWGFHALEDQWKSTTTLLKNLIGNVALNGNMMLNIGPRSNGEVPFEIADRLERMGDWLAKNGEAIYGAGAFDLRADQHDWGSVTCADASNGTYRLYALLNNWPLSKNLPLTGVLEAPAKVYLLEDKSKQPLTFAHHEAYTEVQLPGMAPGPYVSVVVFEYPHKPQIDANLVAKSVYGGYSFTPKNALTQVGNSPMQRAKQFGSVPVHAEVRTKQTYSWKVYVDKPGKLRIDASYHYQGKSDKNALVVRANGKEWKHVIQPTGKTVGEPDSNWVIDNYASHTIGELDVTEPSYVEITTEIAPGKGETVDFQWVWLQDGV